jgi:hypothetical protein
VNSSAAGRPGLILREGNAPLDVALSLAAIHLGAEWTSTRDRTFIGRIVLAGLTLTLAAAGGQLSPAGFVVVVAAAVLGQLLLEAFTARGGAATVLEPGSGVSRE